MADDHGVPLAAATAFLRYLASIERSPNTLRAYASDLRHWFTFLESTATEWTAVNNETLGGFIHQMRSPDPALVGPANPTGRRSESTVNRSLAAVTSFAKYLHETQNDPVYPRLLGTARRNRNPRLDQVLVERTPGPRLRTRAREKRVLTPAERRAIIGACTALRDRFLFTLLDETGMRVGQALLLRHSDVLVQSSTVVVARRGDETSPERNKSSAGAKVPVSPDLIRLYATYMHTEYGLLDCDYVFVNLHAGAIGVPLTYGTVNQLVRRLRRSVGFTDWSAHSFRHTYVTRLLAAHVPVETVSYLVTHSSVLTTMNTYNHLDMQAVREQLEQAGVWAHA